MFEAFYSHSEGRCAVLQSLRQHRHELARSTGFQSFAELRAQSSLFEGNVEAIRNYLDRLALSIRAECIEEASHLLKYSENGLKLWDLAFAKRQDFVENVQRRNAEQSAI